MPSEQPVRDYMTANPARIHEDDPVREAHRIMDTDRYRHLPVIDGHGKVIGMVSDRDLRSYTAGAESVRAGLEGSKGDLPVSRIMARPVEEISPDEEMRSAAQRMLDGGFGALVVIEGKNLIGIVSYTDALRAFVDLE